MNSLMFFFRASAQRFALPALGQGRRSRPARKMIRRVQLLEIAAESPASGARFVGRFFNRNIQFLLFDSLRKYFPGIKKNQLAITAIREQRLMSINLLSSLEWIRKNLGIKLKYSLKKRASAKPPLVSPVSTCSVYPRKKNKLEDRIKNI